MFKKIVYFWLPVIGWCGIIFYLSSIPNLKTELGIWDLILRKAAHMFEYAVLFILAARAFKESGIERNKAYVLGLLFAFFYACSDEYHQSFVPLRGPSVKDVAIDTVGIFLGFTIKKMKRITN